MKKKKYLFYFVHPAKYHLFRVVINKLKKEGHDVDIVITGRDILEELVQKEGWDYIKIFPNGRKLKGVHVYLSAGIYLILTILKLLWITRGKNYDLFVSDDLITFIGRFRGIPSIFVTDDDLSAVPESSILMLTANYIFAPAICDLGTYNKKKLGYWGYKSLAHLHPNHFTPDIQKLDSQTAQLDRYFFIRTVSATSTHDLGKKGITDEVLRVLINHLAKYGKVILNSERQLPPDLQQHVLEFDKNNVAHYLSYATLFVSDSTTMCAEAAVLGTPSIEFDDWFSDFKQYDELNGKYGLLQGFGTTQVQEMINYIDALLANPDIKLQFLEKRKLMLKEKIDVSAFLYWLVSDFPQNPKQFLSNINCQSKFR
jgi:predicted glycosyltransferase